MLQSGIFSRYLEVVEEACVFLYRQNLDKEDLEGCKLEEFVKASLNLVKLAIN